MARGEAPLADIADTSLVGRDRPATTLQAEVDRTMQSHGGLVFVTGEAGIGKTTLIGEVVRYAGEAGALVASGTCWDREGAPGYWPWVQVLRSLQLSMSDEVWAGTSEEAGSELAHLLGEAGNGGGQGVGPVTDESFGLHDAVTTFLVTISRQAPLVVILDDLHWADVASVRLLEFVARHAWFEQLLVVGTYRDVEVNAADHPLGPVLLPVVAKATSITLTGLERDEVGVLLAQAAGRQPSEEMVSEVHHRTGGNPFFVDQTARLWHSTNSVEAVAPGVRDAIERRLAMLPRPVVEVLLAASVIGPEVHRDVLAAAVELSDRELADALAVAATARLMLPADAPDWFSFVHDLVRETLYGSLGDAEARRRHAAVVRAFEETPALRQHSSTSDLAHHASLAVPDLPAYEAVVLLQAAADDAWGRLAVDEAHGHIGRAYSLAPRDRPQQWAQVALDLGWAQQSVGDLDGSRRTFQEVAAFARERGDQELLSRAALKLRGAVWLVSTPEVVRQVTELLAEAHAALVGGEDASVKTDREREQELTLRAVGLARSSGDDEALIDALVARYDALWGPGSAADRVVISEEMGAASRRVGDRAGALFATMLRVVALIEQGDPAGLQEAHRFVAAARSLNTSFSRSTALWVQATVAAIEGRLADAEAYLDEAEAEDGFHDGHQDSDMAALFYQARWAIALFQGDLDRAAWLLLEPETQVHPHVDLLGAVTALQQGEVDPALRYYRKTVAGKPLSRWFQPLWMRFQAQLAAATRDPELCERARRDLAPAEGHWLVMFCAVTDGPVAFWTALVDAAEERWDDAVEGFTSAWQSADQFAAPLWSLEARLHLAEVLHGRAESGRHAEDADRAAQLLEDVEQGAKERRIHHVMDRARHLLDAWGVSPERSSAPSGDVLTSGEARTEDNIFRFDGQVWTLGFGGLTVHMPDAKGLHDLHVLLGRPGADVAAVDLLNPGGGEPVRATHKLGGDPILDENAKAAYRNRLTQLDEEIDRAVLRGQDGKAAELDEERATLIEEIRRATGLGGRSRRLGDEAERARKAVSERIRDTLRRLHQRHPRLAEHLRASVSTGARCSYHPSYDVGWSL